MMIRASEPPTKERRVVANISTAVGMGLSRKGKKAKRCIRTLDLQNEPISKEPVSFLPPRAAASTWLVRVAEYLGPRDYTIKQPQQLQIIWPFAARKNQTASNSSTRTVAAPAFACGKK